jgi:hypothetical protein
LESFLTDHQSLQDILRDKSFFIGLDFRDETLPVVGFSALLVSRLLCL